MTSDAPSDPTRPDPERRPGFVAVVFDMDGVLTDTEVIWEEVRRDLAAGAGVPGPADHVAERTIDALAERYAVHLPVLHGAVEAVRRMARNHRLALVSSSPRRLIDVSLRVMGISELFEVTVSTEEVAAGKPAPDGYRRALELLGVAPSDAVGMEDSANGLRSLAAAGLTAIAVPPHFHPPPAELLSGAAAVIDSLELLDDDLLRRLRSA